MSTTPKCPICHDSGKTIHADGQQSAYLDCGCGAATARAELNQAVAAFAIINRDDLDCDWFIHQRAKALGRSDALAELHPLWLAEKERADRAEARIADIEAKLAEALSRERTISNLLDAWESDNYTGDEVANAIYHALPAAPDTARNQLAGG